VQPQRARQEAKVFWFFFSKKNCFLPFLMTVLACPQPDWLAHTLTVSGPADEVAAFRDQAAGAGVIPWVFDLDQMQEDWFCRLLAPGNDISVQGARILAQTYRGLVSAQHERAVASVGHSRACPFDLYALAPVPPAILRLGPDDPASRKWLWAHWGTVHPLKRVALIEGDDQRRLRSGRARFSFFSADWSPWPVMLRLRARWPKVIFDLQPHYELEAAEPETVKATSTKSASYARAEPTGKRQPAAAAPGKNRRRIASP
jgi:hypothetical protein